MILRIYPGNYGCYGMMGGSREVVQRHNKSNWKYLWPPVPTSIPTNNETATPTIVSSSLIINLDKVAEHMDRNPESHVGIRGSTRLEAYLRGMKRILWIARNTGAESSSKDLGGF